MLDPCLIDRLNQPRKSMGTIYVYWSSPCLYIDKHAAPPDAESIAIDMTEKSAERVYERFLEVCEILGPTCSDLDLTGGPEPVEPP